MTALLTFSDSVLRFFAERTFSRQNVWIFVDITLFPLPFCDFLQKERFPAKMFVFLFTLLIFRFRCTIFGKKNVFPPKSMNSCLHNSISVSVQPTISLLGRPVSMPPLPRVDYQLPRASLSTSLVASLAKNRGQSTEASVARKKKAIRTPSGRNMSASEYLRGGYFPSQTTLPEDEKGGKRF